MSEGARPEDSKESQALPPGKQIKIHGKCSQYGHNGDMKAFVPAQSQRQNHPRRSFQYQVEAIALAPSALPHVVVAGRTSRWAIVGFAFALLLPFPLPYGPSRLPFYKFGSNCSLLGRGCPGFKTEDDAKGRRTSRSAPTVSPSWRAWPDAKCSHCMRQ